MLLIMKRQILQTVSLSKKRNSHDVCTKFAFIYSLLQSTIPYLIIFNHEDLNSNTCNSVIAGRILPAIGHCIRIITYRN